MTQRISSYVPPEHQVAGGGASSGPPSEHSNVSTFQQAQKADERAALRTTAHDDIGAAELNAVADRVAELLAKRRAIKEELLKKNLKNLTPEARIAKEAEAGKVDYELEKLLKKPEVLQKSLEFKLELPPISSEQGVLANAMGAVMSGLGTLFRGLAGLSQAQTSHGETLLERYNALQQATAEPTADPKELKTYLLALGSLLVVRNGEELPEHARQAIERQMVLIEEKLRLSKEAELMNAREEALEPNSVPKQLQEITQTIESLENQLKEHPGRVTRTEERIDHMGGLAGPLARALRFVASIPARLFSSPHEKTPDIQRAELREIESRLAKARFEKIAIEAQIVGTPPEEQFKHLPFVDTVISKVNHTVEDSSRIVERLKNGILREADTDVALEGSEAELARILGAETGQILRKINADQAELSAHLEALKQQRKDVERVLEGVEALRTEYPGNSDLDAKRTRLLQIQNSFERQIRLTSQGLNLLERMKRCQLLQDLTRERGIEQRKINQRNALLKHLNEATRGYSSAPTAEQLDFQENKIGPTLQECENQRDLYEKEIAELTAYATQIDKLFEHELVELQNQDGDPIRNKLPIDGWTPWMIDLARNATGAELGRRLGLQPTNALVQAKLWADQGVTLTEAYTKLGESITAMLAWNDPKRAANELARLLQLPNWVAKNPELVRELIMNIQLILTQLSSNNTDGSLVNLAKSIRDIVITDDWVNDLLVGNREVPNESISPEGLALLHLTSCAPAFLTLSQADNTYLGSVLGTFIGRGQLLGDMATGFFKGLAHTIVTKVAVSAMPAHAGKFFEAATKVYQGGDIKEAGVDLLQRVALRESVGFARDVASLGFTNAVKESWKDFTSWWSKAGWGEKAWRGLTQIVPAVVGVAVGIGVVVASIATLGIPVLLGGTQLIGRGIAWGFGGVTLVSRLNDRVFPDATGQVALERLHRRRDERRFTDEKAREEFLKSTKQPLIQKSE